MDLSRMKKALAGLSVAAVTLTQVGTALAAYSDVPAGVWYADAVSAFVDAGYLDSTQSRFRGSDTANRAEFVKLVVELNGGLLSTPPAVASFSDVPTSAWFYGYFEEAGKEGWVRGDGNCYGSQPCYARPGANINRAEAAALIVRAFGLEASGAAAQFVDNASGQWYTDVIQTAADHCVLQGDDSTGRVRPGDNMNRAEMVVMLHRVDQGLSYGVDCGDEDVAAEPMITDIVATSATTVEVEFNMALDQEVAEDASMYSVMGDDEVMVNSAVLVSEDVVELTLGEALSPNDEYTLTVTDLLTADGWEFSDSMSFGGYSPVVLGDGILEVSLSSSNPVSDTVPSGAVGVVMLSVDLTASCDDSVVIEDLTVLHEGFGDEQDIDGIYAAIDGARVSRKRTIDAEDQTSELRFSSPLVIDPCETVTVDLVADFTSDATVSGEHNLVVELSSDVISNALDVTGNFPLRGNTFKTAAVTSGTVTVEYRTVSPDEVEVGDTGVVIGKFEVSVNSVEDQTFYSMTFEQNSSASDGDFSNIALRRTDGTVLTNTVSQSVGDFVTLVFDPPFTVLEGDKITLEIIADVSGGAGDSLQMQFEESSDLFAVGSLYGYGVNGQLYGSQVDLTGAGTPDLVTIDAGEFTLGINGPATQDYTRDDNDAVLANVTFATGGEKVDIKNLYIAVQGQSSTGSVLCKGGTSALADCGELFAASGVADDQIHEMLEGVEIRNTVTGRTIAGVRVTDIDDASGRQATGSNRGTYQVYRFDDFIVHGDEKWEFRVDFIDNGSSAHPVSGDKFRIHVCGEPTNILSAGSLIDNTVGCDFGGLLDLADEAFQMELEGLSTGDRIGDVRPRGNISGNFHRIANATLTIAVKSLNTDDTTVENAKDINLLRFEARAGEAEDILFTKAIFEAASGSLVDVQNYTLWVDTDSDGTVDTILEDGVASQNNQIPFSDLAGGGFVVPAEETVIFEVHGDISSSITGDDIQIRFDTGATNFVEAEELDDGSNLSGLALNPTPSDDGCSATSCDVTVTTEFSTNWLLVNQGDLFVTQSTVPTRSRQCLGGALCDEVLRLQFHAENEAVDVTDIQITSSGSTASTIDRLELFLDDATQPFAYATIGGCGSDDVLTTNPGNGAAVVQTFCANMESRQLVVPEGSDVDVLVKPRMKRDTAGGTSGQVFGFFIDKTAAADESTGSGAVRGRGDSSSNNLTANNGDSTAGGEVFIGASTAGVNAYISGSKNVSVLSKITSITNANPDPNGTGVPTGVTPFGQFKVAAAAHSNSNNGLNDVILSGATFNVTAANVNLDATSFKFYNKANSSVTTDCDVFTTAGGVVSAVASGSLLVECSALAASLVNTEIDQGKDATFVLQASVTNPKVGSTSSTLQASLQSFNSIANTIFGLASSHLQWLDSEGQATPPEFTWVEYNETTVNSTTYQS